MHRSLLLALLLSALAVSVCGAGFQGKIAPVGGIYRMFNRASLNRGQDFEPVVLRLTLQSTDGQAHTVKVSCRATDIFDQPVPDWVKEYTFAVPADKKPINQDMLLESGMGYFRITASLSEGDAVQTIITDVGIIPPSHPGLRKDSFFASNTSGIRTGQELAFLEAIGMKVQRAHISPNVAAKDAKWASTPSTGAALPLDFTRLDADFAETRHHGVWVLPIVGYSLQGGGGVATTENAVKTGMYGPPRNFDEFVNTWRQVVQRYPEIQTYEFWNEPWIYGWTWCDTPGSYRKLQTAWCKMALKAHPKLRIIAGNSSMFTNDHIAHDPSCWKGLLSGTSHHPYGWGTGQANWRDRDQLRSQDYGMQVTRSMGLPYYYLTEGGTEYRTPPPAELVAANTQLDAINKQLKALADTAPERKDLLAQQADVAAHIAAIKAALPYEENNLENAAKIVGYNINQALIGGFQGNAQWGIGYAPDWTKANTAYAVMTNLLEDRPIVADIWPEHELISGAIFANPAHITPEVKALPRAGELSARWSVPIPEERAGDQTKVAVLSSLTGMGPDALDTAGTLTISKAPDIRAFDISGREIQPKGNLLTVPLNAAAVYLTTDALSVVDFRTRIAGAVIANITPVNLYAQSLAQPATQAQSLTVRVENQMNADVKGELKLSIGAKDAGTTPFTLAAGKLADIAVPWPGVDASATNQYAVTVTAETATDTVDGGKTVTRKLQPVTVKQLIQAARFVKRTITVDGNLDDWKGVTPVVVDSALLKSGVDLTQYLLNPGSERPTGNDKDQRIMANVYTAYDEKNVYLAAAVHEDKCTCSAGQPVVMGRAGAKVEFPYKNAMPDGLNHIDYAGNVFQFAFGFRDRVPGQGRQMNDPYAWKGMYYDTDDVFVAHTSTTGDQLIRHWGEKTERRNAYQTEPVPGYGPVAGGQVIITRNDAAKLTVYELAIPRAEMPLFNPTAGQCRFAFRLYNSENIGPGNALAWAESCGVFDYWRNLGSFTPTWMQCLPCQTTFGIER